MWRIVVLCGLLLSAVLVVPVRTLDARGHSGGGGHSGGSSIKQTVFSPQSVVTSGTAMALSESVDYLFQFNLGQDVSLMEIAPVGSTNWTPLVDNTQTPLRIRNGRIARLHQDIFDNMYTFDIRINGAVVWHNIEVRHERLIVLGYNNGPIIVAIIDHYRK